MEDHKKVEYVLGALLILLILILSIFVINTTSPNKAAPQTNSVIISNSYNTITYGDNDDRSYRDDDYRYIRRNRDGKDYRYDDDDVRFSSRGEHKFVEGIFGQMVSKYYVYVNNKEGHGEYFTVKFYFYDEDRDLTRVTSSTGYIKAHDEKTFKHQNVNEDRYRYDSWEYKVITH